MEIVREKIKNFIFKAKTQNPKAFTPFKIELSSRYSSDSMQEIVDLINENFDSIFHQIKPILAQERLNNIAQNFKFTLETSLSNHLQYEEISNLLSKIFDFQVSPGDLEKAIANPVGFVSSKINYKSISEIDKLIDERITTYKLAYSRNKIFSTNNRTFVIATVLISHEIKRYFDPVDWVSNDYSELKEFCQMKGQDLEKDQQFSKYKLISFGSDYKTLLVYPPRIVSPKYDFTIFLNGVDDFVFKFLLNLKARYNFNLAFKPSSIFYLDGIYKTARIEEHLETGLYFNLKSINGELITKLYNDDYDTFWVKIDHENITFEEILQNFESYGDMVVTQVVHCLYIKNGNSIYITHLDHEFIFYTINEFDERQKNKDQKGTARPRIKTFKIDDAEIPISENENVLFEILAMKFKRQELVEEYFQKLRKLN